MTSPDSDLVARFRGDLDRLVGVDAKVGVAVSGGPDSLALLLLCAAARPGLIEAATVDHGLRPESRAEAAAVAEVCSELNVPHATLTVGWDQVPTNNLPAAARDARYACLSRWAHERGLGPIVTAHHLDDQAETVLMRLARGSGVRGLAGMADSRSLGGTVILLRPLLAWRRSELDQIVKEASLTAIDDPTNRDKRFDRTHARTLLEETSWLDPVRLASSASHCRDAEAALAWTAAREFGERSQVTDGKIAIDPSGLPVDLQRRLMLIAIERLAAKEPRGPDLIAAVERLGRGEITTLSGIRMQGGPRWCLSVAAPRRKRTE